MLAFPQNMNQPMNDDLIKPLQYWPDYIRGDDTPTRDKTFCQDISSWQKATSRSCSHLSYAVSSNNNTCRQKTLLCATQCRHHHRRSLQFPVCRVWPILTRSWVRQQSRTSGAGALKPCKNRKVRHYTMGTTSQK